MTVTRLSSSLTIRRLMGRQGRRRLVRRLAVLGVLLLVLLPFLSGCGSAADGVKSMFGFGQDAPKTAHESVTAAQMRSKLSADDWQKILQAQQVQRQSQHPFTCTLSRATVCLEPNGGPSSVEEVKKLPDAQVCEAWPNDGHGTWSWDDKAKRCGRDRQLTWLEAGLWQTYQNAQSDNLSWLTTKRDTLTASADSVNTLRAGFTPDYQTVDSDVAPFLNIAQGVLLVVAVISLIVAGGRFLWGLSRRDAGGEDGTRLMGKAGWIFLGVGLGAMSVSIASNLFGRAGNNYHGPGFQTVWTLNVPSYAWSPSSGWTTTFFVSDVTRLLVDPFMIVCAVIGLVFTGFRLAVSQDGRELVNVGRAYGLALIESAVLAQGVTMASHLLDGWSGAILKASAGMVEQAWRNGTLSLTGFLDLQPILAIVMCVLLFISGIMMKLCTYARMGLLPIMVGLAPLYACMSYSKSGRMSHGRVLGWLVACLMWKPVAALTLAVGSAVLASGKAGDDSGTIVLGLTLLVSIMLPVLIRLMAPAVADSVGSNPTGVVAMAGGATAGGVVGVLGGAVRGAGRWIGSRFNKARTSSGGSGGELTSGSGSGGGGRHTRGAIEAAHPDGSRSPVSSPLSSPAPQGATGQAAAPSGSASSGSPGIGGVASPIAQGAGKPDGAQRKSKEF